MSLREIMQAIFNNSHDDFCEITAFSGWHFMYVIIILGLTIGMAFVFRHKSEKVKTTNLNVLAYCVIGVYILDFFIMPFSQGKIDIDKLPFHFCTLIGCLIPFAQFNKKFEPIKDVIACLAIVTSLMYITYPGSALGSISTFSYKVIQTFLFHGLVLAWGFLSLATGGVKLKWKTIWKEAIAVAVIMLWACFGNFAYNGIPDGHYYDWCFITGSTFDFVPAWVVPIAVYVAVFGMCALIFLIYNITVKIMHNHNNKKLAVTTTSEDVVAITTKANVRQNDKGQSASSEDVSKISSTDNKDSTKRDATTSSEQSLEVTNVEIIQKDNKVHKTNGKKPSTKSKK